MLLLLSSFLINLEATEVMESNELMETRGSESERMNRTMWHQMQKDELKRAVAITDPAARLKALLNLRCVYCSPEAVVWIGNLWPNLSEADQKALKEHILRVVDEKSKEVDGWVHKKHSKDAQKGMAILFPRKEDRQTRERQRKELLDYKRSWLDSVRSFYAGLV